MAQGTYQLINLTAGISPLILTWPSQFTGGPVILDRNDINADVGPYVIQMPNATLVNQGEYVVFNNVSGNPFVLKAVDGTTVIGTIASGTVIEMYLIDNTTSNGTWRLTYRVGFVGLTAITATSTDGSVIITGSPISPPDGTINLALPATLTNLNTSIEAAGYLTVLDVGPPLVFSTNVFVGGDNIDLTNPDGVAGDTIISLSSNLTNVDSAEIGSITISANTIYTADTNSSMAINSNGTGVVSLNGVTIDTSGNIANINNFNMPKAQVTFIDTVTGSSHTINIIDSVNITSVTYNGSSASYDIVFTTAFATNDYGVLLSLGTDGNPTSPFVAHAFLVTSTKATSGFSIIVVDASGIPLVDGIPNGLTIQVLQS